MFSIRSSVRARLRLAVSVLALTAVIAIAISARQSTRREFRKFQELERVSSNTAGDAGADRIAAALTARCCAPAALRAATALLAPHEALVVVDGERKIVLASAGAPLETLRDLHIGLDGDLLTIDGTRSEGTTIEGIALKLHGGPARPIALASGQPAYVRLVTFPRAGPDAPERAFLGSVDRRLLAITGAIGALALAAAWLLTARIAGPIADLRDATRDLAAGDLSRRVAARGNDEIADLAHGFNAMATDLERQQTLRRNLVHDVAHELRTPLTALRCRLETIADGLSSNPAQALSGAREEVQHLTRLVDDLQELALAEAGDLRLNIERLQLGHVIRSAARAAGLEGDSRFRVECDDDVAVKADAIRVRQVLVNLLTNAERHTPRDGTILVRTEPRAPEVELEVLNTGSTLDDEQLAHLFHRFYRADPARQRTTGGTGLGLAIVKHLVEAQGGRVWAHRSPGAPGTHGMTFGFALPIDDTAH
jgi:signal transduction histidine kinase